MYRNHNDYMYNNIPCLHNVLSLHTETKNSNRLNITISLYTPNLEACDLVKWSSRLGCGFGHALRREDWCYSRAKLLLLLSGDWNFKLGTKKKQSSSQCKYSLSTFNHNYLLNELALGALWAKST